MGTLSSEILQAHQQQHNTRDRHGRYAVWREIRVQLYHFYQCWPDLVLCYPHLSSIDFRDSSKVGVLGVYVDARVHCQASFPNLLHCFYRKNQRRTRFALQLS